MVRTQFGQHRQAQLWVVVSCSCNVYADESLRQRYLNSLKVRAVRYSGCMLFLLQYILSKNAGGPLARGAAQVVVPCILRFPSTEVRKE